MSIRLRLFREEDGPILWELANLHRKTADGIVYGFFYAFRHDPNRYMYELEAFGQGYYRTYKYEKYIISQIKYYPNLARHDLDGDFARNMTGILLRTYDERLSPDIIRYESAPGEYLQGLFTALNYYGEPITDVLLAKPYRNGIYYNVDELQLPDLFQ